MPLKAVAAIPAGSISTRLTMPLVAAAPELLTVIVNVSPTSPGWKIPEPESAMLTVKSGTAMIVTISAALEVLTSPPPETVAVLVRLPKALEEMLTVSVSAE